MNNEKTIERFSDVLRKKFDRLSVGMFRKFGGVAEDGFGGALERLKIFAKVGRTMVNIEVRVHNYLVIALIRIKLFH